MTRVRIDNLSMTDDSGIFKGMNFDFEGGIQIRRSSNVGEYGIAVDEKGIYMNSPYLGGLGGLQTLHGCMQSENGVYYMDFSDSGTYFAELPKGPGAILKRLEKAKRKKLKIGDMLYFGGNNDPRKPIQDFRITVLWTQEPVE